MLQLIVAANFCSLIKFIWLLYYFKTRGKVNEVKRETLSYPWMLIKQVDILCKMFKIVPMWLQTEKGTFYLFVLMNF